MTRPAFTKDLRLAVTFKPVEGFKFYFFTYSFAAFENKTGLMKCCVNAVGNQWRHI